MSFLSLSQIGWTVPCGMGEGWWIKLQMWGITHEVHSLLALEHSVHPSTHTLSVSVCVGGSCFLSGICYSSLISNICSLFYVFTIKCCMSHSRNRHPKLINKLLQKRSVRPNLFIMFFLAEKVNVHFGRENTHTCDTKPVDGGEVISFFRNYTLKQPLIFHFTIKLYYQIWKYNVLN